MDLNAFGSPGVLITLISLIVGLIVWIVRLESRNNDGHRRIDDIEDLADKVEKQLKAVEVEFYKHMADVKAHHNEEAVKEFRTALEQRFAGVENSLKDISRKLNHIAGRE